MAKQVLVVLSNAVEGTDDEFNRWYTGTHLGEVLKLNGYVAAQRFKLSGGQLGPGYVPYRYFALYEVDAEDPADPAQALLAGIRSMDMSATLDLGKTVAWFYTPMTERVAAES